jgi:hypothetical protein
MIPRARHLAAAALSALLLPPALSGTAAAHSGTGEASSVYSVTLTKTVADVQRVAEYWKPEQLKRADSYSPATPGSQSSPTAAAAPAAGSSQGVTTAIRSTKVPLNVSGALPQNGTAARTMGKVFFRFGDKEFWCSASAVAARNRSVVATAAHCAYDSRQGKPAEYWIFVPNPGADGAAPDGIYVGASISMHEHWPGKGDYDYDYAFVTVNRGFTWTSKDGKLVPQDIGRLQDRVGGQGLALSKGLDNTLHAFGYPAGPQPDGTRTFDGRKLQMCTGTTRRTVAPSLNLQYGVQLAPCNFSAGASGGPWLIGFRSAQQLGGLNGINSLTWNRDAKGAYDAISSPSFTAATGEVYRRAATRTAPQM